MHCYVMLSNVFLLMHMYMYKDVYPLFNYESLGQLKVRIYVLCFLLYKSKPSMVRITV